MTESLTLEEIEKLERLGREATAGPWRADIDDPTTDPYWTGKIYGPENFCIGDEAGAVNDEARTSPERTAREVACARLIVETRNSLPALLALARRALQCGPVVEAAEHWYESRVDDEAANRGLIEALKELRRSR